METLLVEARSADLSVGDPHADLKCISIATSPFFPLAGTASEKPLAFNLDRDCLKGLLDWIVDRLWKG